VKNAPNYFIKFSKIMANYKVKLFKNGKYEGWCGVLKSRAEAEACGKMHVNAGHADEFYNSKSKAK
jgi:hypothetical protein